MESNGQDVPFTTQIKNANVCWNLHQITADPIMTEAGTYQFGFVIDGEELTRVSLEVQDVPQPPGARPPGA
ncbi:MAG TPA: hypothetical protein VIJ12_04075 [Candidatus Baltobacteraceae bacterium]